MNPVFPVRMYVLSVVIILNSIRTGNSGHCKYSCSSNGCLKQANTIINNIKPNVNPCDDFYGFACGTYMEKFGKEETKNVYDETWLHLQVLIKDLLDNLHPAVNSVSEKMKTVYDTCMDVETSEQRSLPDSLKILTEIGIPNWPNLNPNFTFQNPDLSQVLGGLAAYGEFSFITFNPSPYSKTHANAAHAQFPLILPGTFLLNSKLIPKDVEGSVLKILSFFNVNKSESRKIWKNFEAIENIGIKLQNTESKNIRKCESNARFKTVNCSANNEDNMNPLCSFWKSVIRYGNLEKFFSRDTIHISCQWNQYHYIENILSSLSNVDHRFIAHYLVLRFFLAHLDDINTHFQLVRKAHSGIRESKQRATDPISRWEYCISWIIKSMNLALGFEYSRDILTKSIQSEVLRMIQEYMEELKRHIRRQSWINDKVKSYLRKQLEAIEIGFENAMKIYRNETFVSEYYKQFYPVKGRFLETILEYQKMAVTLNRKDVSHFNGFYSSSDPYTMDFGFALFLPPIYSDEESKLWNYATLGMVIGHELMHNLKLAFDLVQLDDETERNLNSKIQCYVRQYTQILENKIGNRVKSISADKKGEMDEEITADNLGWSLTEKILNKHMSSNWAISSLPSLQYTPQQILYIIFAQACCEVMSKNVENEFYITNPHSVERFRVFSMLQNSKMFAEAFNCPLNTTMNPITKCIFLE